MTFVKLNGQPHKTKILSNLALNVARRMGLRMTAYDATAVKDGSGDVRWMYVFDEHESRIYSVRNGLQRFENIELDADGLIDLDEAERQIKTAIDRLIIKHY